MLLSNYMNCGDLLNFMRRRGTELSTEVKLSLAKQVAEGMHYLAAEK